VAGDRVGQVTLWGPHAPVPVLLVACALALVLGACGSSHATQDADAQLDVLHLQARVAPRGPSGEARLARFVRAAQRAYNRESKGSKLVRETNRLATDAVLLGALARGDAAGVRAETQAQLLSTTNHLAHVTRISVMRGARVLANATLNSDGVFVVTPAVRELRLHGRPLGTLLVSIQDVTGFVKLVHRRTLADVVARGASGEVRTSLPAAAQAHLPPSGHATVAGRSYAVRSFSERAWGGEPLTVWILVRH
jgi:hypothetical protein